MKILLGWRYTARMADTTALLTSEDWYIYGECAIDRMLGTSRAETIQVFARGAPPAAVTVRTRLGNHSMSVEITDSAPRPVCTLDEVVLTPSGELCDVVTGEHITQKRTELKIVTFDLAPSDILRLHRLRAGYPEISFEPGLAEYLEASFEYLRSLRHRFEELELLFLQNAPFTRWRTQCQSGVGWTQGSSE